jgi:peptidyl-prolyl cis-trans isomerase A (cyclophilin A)
MKAVFLAAALVCFVGIATAQTPALPSAIATPAPPKTYATVRVVLTTSLGPITVALEKERAPITSANFLRYVDQKRFDGISFFRRSQAPGEPTKGFVQAGTTDPKRVLPPIAHEPTSKTGLTHSDGALSAPRFAPGSARGDFTIIIGGAPWMDADPKAPGDNLGFAVFGRVVEGMDVVAKILAAPTSTTKGDGVFKGEILEPPVRIISARRAK